MCATIFACLILVISVVESSDDCPSQETISYCSCWSDPSFQSNLHMKCNINNLTELYTIYSIGTSYSSHISKLSINIHNIETLPSLAICYNNLNTLEIIGDLTSIDEDAFIGLESLLNLYLSDTRLLEFPTAAVLSLINLSLLELRGSLINSLHVPLQRLCLKRLLISDSNISTIETDVLPTTLVYLDLSSNRFDSVNDILRGNLTDLTTLHISDNNIRSFGDDLKCTPNLKELSAKRNRIASIDDGSLVRIPNLEELSLASNRIVEVIDGLRGLIHLRFLDLSFNGLTHLDTMAFVDLTAIETLNLGYNNLTYIQDGLLDCLISLNFLIIHYNNLNELNFLIVPTSSDLLVQETSVGLERENCTFRDSLPLKHLFVRNSGVICNDAINQTVQYLRSRNVDIAGNPCRRNG